MKLQLQRFIVVVCLLSIFFFSKAMTDLLAKATLLTAMQVVLETFAKNIMTTRKNRIAKELTRLGGTHLHL